MALIALHSASTGLSSLNTELDVTANNLANVNTTGFRASRVNFQDLLYLERATPGTENANGDQRPTGLYVGLGVQVSGTQLSFEQGSILPSPGRPLDVAIEGDGFFKVQIEPERGGGFAYTRAGHFTRNADGELVLATDQGRRLEPNITIPPQATEISIAGDGTVNFIDQTGARGTAGQIQIANFINPAGLTQIGETLFTATEASGPEILANPGEQGLGELLGGFIESSNVDPTRELISLIRTQRAFEMNSQVIRAADETLQAAAQLRR